MTSKCTAQLLADLGASRHSPKTPLRLEKTPRSCVASDGSGSETPTFGAGDAPAASEYTL